MENTSFPSALPHDILPTQLGNQEPVGTGPFGPDWKKKTALFLTGQTVSLFGSSLVQFVIIWYITLTTQSGMMMTLATVFGFLPQIVISIFAGVWADRVPRKKLIIWADAGIAFFTLLLIVAFMTGFREIWLLFVISGIRSVGTGIQSPAVNALLPQLVPPQKLMKVNGINSSIQSLTLLISPAVGGALLTAAPLEICFMVDVVTALVAIVLMVVLKVMPLPKTEGPKAGYFDDLRAGFSYMRTHPFIKDLLVFFAVFFFLIVPGAYLTPLLIARNYGEEVWRLTANEVIYSGGAILGGLAIAAWGGLKNRLYTIALFSGLFGLLMAVLGFTTNFVAYLIIMLMLGVCGPFLNATFTVMLQEKTDAQMQGRMFGFVQIIISTVMPLGMLIFGPLADVVKIEWLLIITGVVMVITGVCILFNHRLREAGKPLEVKSEEKTANNENIRANP